MNFHIAQLWRRKGRYRGNAVLEAALVLPILTSVAFGTIEYGNYFFVKNTLQAAAREGARAALVSGGTNQDVSSAVAAVMTAAGYTSGQYSIVTSPTNVATAAASSNVSISVNCTWGTVGIRPLKMISAAKTVSGVAVMRKES